MFTTLLLPTVVTTAFSPAYTTTPRLKPLNAVGIFYSTTTGNTETIAGYIQEATGLDEIYDIGSVEASTFTGFDGMICGAPTWHTGADEQRSGTSWDDVLYGWMQEADLSGKTIAIFGVGDQGSYAENFCDAAGELYDVLTERGAKVIGFTSTDGYDHDDSKAIRDGMFCGLMCDEDNQYDLSAERASTWISKLKADGMPF
ncbi:hypothetical protein CTAYLR_001388 [Chrysophaeum taylorii]|uniref:Flavodoxin-like domain-containing protein n=1 Tax=Chrysophaeum taylorii TaxID=2483200 RepID=A0AAD7XHG2_9STRA|nr:hypothetical protein CTAYLR_001388 [Chrysophaeum taylorii]